MRIGIDARMYGAQSTSGIGVYIEHFIAHLLDCLDSDTLVLFVKSEIVEQVRQRYAQHPIEVVATNISWYGWSEQLLFPRHIRKNAIDVMHFPHFNVPILYNDPYVVTVHDVTPFIFPGPNVQKKPWRKCAYRLVFRHALAAAKQIISISQHTKDNIKDVLPKKLFEKVESKISVILLAPPKIYQSSESLPFDATELGINKPFLLYVGVWRDHKNIETLIAAFELLRQQGRDIQLVLAGKPDPGYPEIALRINSSSQRSNILTPGFVEPEVLDKLYRKAVVFVLPSFCEGFGLVALEAVMRGTPVVASETTSVPEILQQYGTYFDPKNPEMLASRISQELDGIIEFDASAAKSFIEQRYSWKKVARQTYDIYKQFAFSES